MQIIVLFELLLTAGYKRFEDGSDGKNLGYDKESGTGGDVGNSQPVLFDQTRSQ